MLTQRLKGRMMEIISRDKIESKKKDIKSIFSNYWFIVPEYQRSYVWDTENVNDLLDDLYFAFSNKRYNEYFLGSLVLKRTEQASYDEYEVLDGQQRLTTFLLMMAVIRDLTIDDKLKEITQKRIYQEENEYDAIPERIRIVYKIRDDVESFIKEYVLQENGTLSDDLTQLINSKNISISNMVKAIVTMKDYFLQIDNLEEFSKFFPLKGIFISVSTTNREDAFRMFTILNNRGTPLTNADILKSMNIGAIVDKDENRKFAKIWESVEGDLGDDFDRFLSFIRTIFVKEKARVNLLEEFKENIYKKNLLKVGQETINLMKDYKNIYDSLIKFENINISNDYKNLITIMRIGLQSEDWIPPLMYYYKKFGTDNLIEFLEKLEYKFSTDWILQKYPTERIENMNKILKSINSASNSGDVIIDNDLFYVDNDSLANILDQNVYGRRFARYILLKYEYLISDNTVHLSDYKTISVEHILPQQPRPDSQWVRDFPEDLREVWTHKLSNLVLISKRKNSTLSNLDFDEKKRRYLQNRIDVFNGSKIFIHQNNQWTVKEVTIRQEEMLNKLMAT